MSHGLLRTLVLLSVALSTAAASASPARRVVIGPGIYRPEFPASPSETEVKVRAFALDTTPVTNARYLEFVRAHPAWRRGQIKSIRADAGYLQHWAGPTSLGDKAGGEAPVVFVSWFAAKAYCAANGGRLPTEREWELAAAASERARDGRDDPAWKEKILAWYAQPTPEVLPAVGQGRANAWGVHDLHGLVWEWVYDFGSALVVSDDRERGDAARDRYCGAGAAASRDPAEYATFMRLAMRSSLQARYTTANLGFRCAYDVAAKEPRR